MSEENLEGLKFFETPLERRYRPYKKTNIIEAYIKEIANSDKPSATIDFNVLKRIGNYSSIASASRAIGRTAFRLFKTRQIKSRLYIWGDKRNNVICFNKAEKLKESV